MTLALLITAATGAWATDETLLTTITPTGDGTYSETTAGAVTVTPAGSFFYSNSSYGWRWDDYGSLTVTANEGYTIARCVFIQQGKNQSVTISEAPFALNFEAWVCLENTSMDGVTSIEVYGTAPAAPAGPTVTFSPVEGKTNEWTLDGGMPAGNVVVNVTYCDLATLATGAVTAATEAAANTDAELVTVADGAATGGTLMYYVTTDANFTQAQAIALAETAWSEDVPTADGLNFDTATDVYVWYYLKGDADHSDTDPVCVTVTLLPEPTYNVTFAEGIDDADKWIATPNTDLKKGDQVTITYTGTKKIIGVKAEKKSSAPTLKDALADGATVVITYTWYGDCVTTFTYTNNGGTYTGNTTGYDSEYFGNGMSKDGTTLKFSASNIDNPEANVSIDFNTDTNEYVANKGSGFTSFTISVNGTDFTSQLTEVVDQTGD